MSLHPHLALDSTAGWNWCELVYHCPMSEAIAFDTHRDVKHLTENGFTEQQAETLAEEQVALLNGNLATRVDLAALKADLIKWMFGAVLGGMVAMTGLFAAIVGVMVPGG